MMIYYKTVKVKLDLSGLYFYNLILIIRFNLIIRFPQQELLVPSLEESLDGPLLKPDLCQTQCQSCLKEAERQMAGTTVPITVRRPRGVLHAGVLGVSDGWSSGSSPSSASPAPRPRGPPPPPI